MPAEVRVGLLAREHEQRLVGQPLALLVHQPQIGQSPREELRRAADMELGQVDDVDTLVLEGGDKRRLSQRGRNLAVAGGSLQAEYSSVCSMW